LASASIRPGAVSSCLIFGELKSYSPQVAKRFRNVADSVTFL